MVDQKSIGSRAQVMHGNARKTSGGLTKSQLKYNKQGKIVSRKASALAKKNNRLVKAGYKTQKGVFGNGEMRGGGMGDYKRIINLTIVESIVDELSGKNVTYCNVLKPSILTGLSSTKCGTRKNGTIDISIPSSLDYKVKVSIPNEDDMNNCEIWCYSGGYPSCDTKISKYLFKNDSGTIKVELKTT